MAKNTWTRVEQLFHAAMDKPNNRRSAYLRDTCKVRLNTKTACALLKHLKPRSLAQARTKMVSQNATLMQVGTSRKTAKASLNPPMDILSIRVWMRMGLSTAP